MSGAYYDAEHLKGYPKSEADMEDHPTLHLLDLIAGQKQSTKAIHISRDEIKCLHDLFYWCKSNLLVGQDQYMDFIELLGRIE